MLFLNGACHLRLGINTRMRYHFECLAGHCLAAAAAMTLLSVVLGGKRVLSNCHSRPSQQLKDLPG
eukprot:scaffold678339_cov57-Prasinocladus_malaysianus.AAC.1